MVKMEKLNKLICITSLLILILGCFEAFSKPLEATSKMSFWQVPKKGANIFNQKVSKADIRAAKTYGIEFIRLAPDKFHTAKRDFLIGNADKYEGLVHEDLKALKSILDICAEENMPVIITMLSLPGSRWKQNNHDNDDLRIWTDKTFQTQASKFWFVT